MKRYGMLASSLIVVWFVFDLAASALQVFRNASNRIGLQVAIAAVVPILLFSLWFASSKKFRQFTLSLDVRLLTLAQAWRIVGFTFVLLEAKRMLPAIFAWPAGYGDMAIGASATLVAWRLATPNHRGSFILWQALGIADLVNAVTVGTTAPLLRPYGPSMAPMTVLPLSLVPIFLVPLFFIFHVICIAQAKAWVVKPGLSGGQNQRAQTAFGGPSTSAAR